MPSLCVIFIFVCFFINAAWHYMIVNTLNLVIWLVFPNFLEKMMRQFCRINVTFLCSHLKVKYLIFCFLILVFVYFSLKYWGKRTFYFAICGYC